MKSLPCYKPHSRLHVGGCLIEPTSYVGNLIITFLDRENRLSLL
jgi:hypothetical protein